MKKSLVLACLIIGFSYQGYTQFSRYIIRFKDKAGTPYLITDPSRYLSQRSIDRRTKFQIPVDQTDLPVTPAYLDSLRLAGSVTILNVSKWLNQACILTTDAQALAKINSFSFVLAALPIAARIPGNITPVNKQLTPGNAPFLPPAARPQSPADVFDYGLAYPQIHMHNAEFLHNQGFRGEGMRLAIMDAGFYHYQSLPTFDSIRRNNQVLDTWDYVANEASVDEDHPHGMNCFSTIAANLPGSFIGTAPKSKYYLYRTEDAGSEYPVEEQNFAAAAEKADSLGVDVFSVSLGYNLFDNSRFNYTYADMDGNTTMITRAADYAAAKGILVVAAAGNDGNGSWKYIAAPADGDSVLSVGAVNANKQPASFSAYGPTSDGRIKPDVAAVGQGAVVANQVTGLPSYNNGTSFACPILAGIATCLWQAFPEVNNMAIIDVLRRSADRFNSPDDRTGYGIPDAKKAFVFLLTSLYRQQISVGSACKVKWSGTVKAGAGMVITLERKLPAAAGYSTLSSASFAGKFTNQDFSFTDDLSGFTVGTQVGYRLKMAIGTDTSFYLDSANVNYTGTCSPTRETIVISPNPAPEQVTIAISKSLPARVTVLIHNISGQEVYRQTEQVTASATLTIPTRRFMKGIYFISVYFDDKQQVVKTIIR
jgi:hypothetical protein